MPTVGPEEPDEPDPPGPEAPRPDGGWEPMRRLQRLTGALSGALEEPQIVSIMLDAGREALGASAGHAWRVRGDAVELGAAQDGAGIAVPEAHRRFPLSAPLPVSAVIATGELLLLGSRAELRARYPEAVSESSPSHAWAVLPFVVGGRGIGAVSFSFDRERSFTGGDRELLAAMLGQVSLALERCRLLAALRANQEQLRLALSAARAATWQVDISTMQSVRDASYREIVGEEAARAPADFSSVHPDDRAHARASFERAVREGAPYEPEVRIRRDDGSYFWVRAHGRLVRGADGGPDLLAGVIVDIDEAKRASLRAEEAHRQSEALYDTVREQKEQLERAVERARLADRRKDEFLAMLGHELRNPLAPISTALGLMDMHGAGPPRERAVIRRQVDHLSRLIDDLLDVSRITRGKLQLSKQVVELAAVLAQAVEIASPLLEQRHQRLVLEVPREGLAVEADPTRLAQVFQNLLTNAAKYSEPRSEITVRAWSEASGEGGEGGEGGRITVEVRDQGIGIPADVLPHLFELFVQGERALDRAQGGLGIGLTIARSLCELHGGTIEATSDGPGRGSTFTVGLPRSARAPAPPQRRSGEIPARAAAAVRVLVVDDNVDAAEMLRDLLESVGHEAAVAHDGPAALELATAFGPDVALLDIGLPVMDGYELARKLREQPGREGLRLIAVTGYGQDSDRSRSRAAGFDHHLTKPIHIDELLPLIAGDR